MDRKRLFDILFDGVKAWTKYGLLWLLLTFILRLVFFFMLKTESTTDWSAFLTILSGVYFDLAVVFFVGIIVLVPFLIINWLLPKTTKVLSMLFITVYVVVYSCLMGYFMNVTQPLDRVFFIYTPEELYNIVVSSVQFSLLPFVGVLVAVFLYSLLLRFWNRKVKVQRLLALSYLSVSLLFVIIFNYKSLITNEMKYRSHRDYCMAVNQIAYTINDFDEYWKQSKVEDFSEYDESVLADAEAYQSRFPDFKYIDIHYPFLRVNDDPDILGGFLNRTSDGKAPDFVFIIVEGLGQRLSSAKPKMSFTPFVDSLKAESLYWPNALALAERTFGVMPNVFSSAPYDRTGFARIWMPIPDHNSILKDMSKNGYSLSFYYGGNASFDGQNEYMDANGVGYVMNPSEADFDPDQKEALANDHAWGMYDGDMFNAAIRHRDTVARNRPNTDIYMTLTTHEPFYFKGQQPYIEKVRQMLAETTEFGPYEKLFVTKNDYMYATYLYTDECLKKLINYYKTLPEYENTIFVIMGDHRTGCVPVCKEHLSAYNIPLIIYSPLIKSPKMFKGVVTHHDIAPTITAYLKNNYDYHVDDVCHWLGHSLDTSAVFRCNQSVAFMLNNRDVIEYLHNNYILSFDRVYELKDDIIGEEIDNDSIKNTLYQYLQQYRNIDNYVTRNDFLIKKPNNLAEVAEVELTDEVSCHVNQGGRYKIVDEIEFTRKFERLYVDVRFDFKIKNNVDLQDIAIEVYSVDKRPVALFFKGYRFSELSKKTDDGYAFKLKTTFFIANDEMMDYPMAISFSTKKDLDIDISNVKIKVEGK